MKKNGFVFLKRLLLVLLCLMCMTSCQPSANTSQDNGSSSVPDEPSTEADKSTENSEDDTDQNSPVSEVFVGKLRIQLLSNTLIRIEMKRNGKFEDRPSYTVTNRTNWEKVSFTKNADEKHQIISTDTYDVYVPNNASSLEGVHVTDKSGNELWHFETTTTTNVYLPSPSENLNSWYFTDSPRVIPSESGYSISESGYKLNNGWETHADATDMFVFLPDGNYRTFTKDFITLTGSSEMLPLNLFGYWDSRFYRYTADSALAQVQEYLDRGYSIDVLVIDTEWRDASSGVGYQVNEELFPNLEEFFDKIHDMGVSVFFNDHPEPVQGTGSLLDKEEIKYRSKNLKLILSLGLDYWWYDRNWIVSLNPAAENLSVYSTGMYAFQFITQEYYESVVANDPQAYARRAIIMGNADGILHGNVTYAPDLASHRFSLQWTGDIKADSAALKQEIRNAISGGIESGLPYISSDLGGHLSEVTDEMYVRWMQYGALSTICRVHCTKPYSRMPWLYGETAEAVTKEYVGMRYRLLPLYYALAHENYVSGLPIMRRLDINYPQYIESSVNDQYLLGDYILVAPISDDVYVDASESVEFTHNGKSGLYTEYFKNTDLSGKPSHTELSDKIYCDWGTDGPSQIGLSDNFSIRWSGEITIKNKDTKLSFYSDDGVRVWIDDKLVIDGWNVYDIYQTTDTLKAGSKHKIKVEYCELAGSAHIYMTSPQTEGSTRNVFIPDGTWIDVWTGETVTGPKTITVSHPLNTSPIFVRAGSVVALAEDMQNTSEKNWSNMTLDVYPSKDYSAKTTIYEDDTKTVAYKDGKYRTTDITMEYTDALTINIAAAEGTFVDDFRAFEERNFNVRIHAREDFGAIQKITLNGKEVAAEIYEKSSNASPFAFSSSARDSVVHEITFKTNIRNANQIKVFFENPVEDGKNEEYVPAVSEFTLKDEQIAKEPLNLSQEGCVDYAFFGYDDAYSVLRMKDGKGLIGELNSSENFGRFVDNYPISWNNGDKQESGTSTNGPVANNFDITLKTTEGKNTFTIYLGGYQSIANLEVSDKNGITRFVTFGNQETNFYRKITIEYDSEVASEIHVSYKKTSGNNITFSAVTVME